MAAQLQLLADGYQLLSRALFVYGKGTEKPAPIPNAALSLIWGSLLHSKQPGSHYITVMFPSDLENLIKMHSSGCELTLYTKCFLHNQSTWFNGSIPFPALCFVESFSTVSLIAPMGSLRCTPQGHCSNTFFVVWFTMIKIYPGLLKVLAARLWVKQGACFEACSFVALRVYKAIPYNVRMLLCECVGDHHGQEQKGRL